MADMAVMCVYHLSNKLFRDAIKLAIFLHMKLFNCIQSNLVIMNRLGKAELVRLW